MSKYQTVNTPTFGPGGNGEWFKQEGGKATLQAPGWLKSKGLDAYEYEAGKGITAGEGALTAIGQKAREHGILMSLHTPYFISLLAHRAGFSNANRIALLGGVVFIVGGELLLEADYLLIQRVGSTALNFDHNGLVLHIAYHDADAFLTVSALAGIFTHSYLPCFS